VDLVAQRRFHDTAYHFDEDVEVPGFQRLWHALRPLEPLVARDLLDLGYGVGWAAHVATERGANVVDLDLSSRALSLAASIDGRPLWVQGDGGRLPLADVSFDRALSFGSLEHFPDVRAALLELRRVLRASGRAAVVVPNF
jgi:ubiquinone/menaquinone biosynthesis C-methylase UbiE